MTDRWLDEITDAVVSCDQVRAADAFFRMVTDGGRSLADAVGTVISAEAPYVQVPSHVNVRDGVLKMVSNDHTLLGLRTSLSLTPFMPASHRLLPLLQSVWFVPAGIDIWDQLLGTRPGYYTWRKVLDVPVPSGPPPVWRDDQEPIVEGGSLDERLHQHMLATMTGDVARSYGLFLGLADDATARPRARDHLMSLALMDVQDTIIGRRIRNQGHKALRARAAFDLADAIGWDDAHDVFYAGVPDLAVGPLSCAMYDEACVYLAEELPDSGRCVAENAGRLDDREVEELVDTVAGGDRGAAWASLTDHLRRGVSLPSLGDAVQIAACEAVLRTVEPDQFTDSQHAFDYANTANGWIRRTRHPLAVHVLYAAANGVSDTVRCNGLVERPSLDRLGPLLDEPSLEALDEAILHLDLPRSMSIAYAYLADGGDPQTFQVAVAITACKFQNDPHNQQITHAAFEEYASNTTHLRDRLLLAPVRVLAGWPKDPGELECYSRFLADWSVG